MRVYKDQGFKEESFILEEVVFIRCTLTDCDLFYSGGDFEFVELKMNNCRFHFRGAANNTQMLAHALGMLRSPEQIKTQMTLSSPKPN